MLLYDHIYNVYFVIIFYVLNSESNLSDWNILDTEIKKTKI